MMEIKFRAWDKVAENMFIIFDANEQTEWFLPKWKDRYEVMQYTGLKDVKGVEIYKGDIVFNECTIGQPRGKLTTKNIGEVQILNGMTYIVGKSYQYVDGKNIMIAEYRCLMFSPDLFEVIGNIYENPELIS